MTIQLKQGDLPLTMKCVQGEEWPITEFATHVHVLMDEIDEDAITIACPVGHEYPLSRAIRNRLVSRKIADKMLEMAREAAPRLRELQNNPPPYKASEMQVDPELAAKGWSCVKCGKKAECKTSHRGEKESVLCRECRAEWANYGRGKDIFQLFSRARGFSRELYWLAAFYRFVLNLPTLSEKEHEAVLTRCRTYAKGRRSIDVAFLKSLAQNPSTE